MGSVIGALALVAAVVWLFAPRRSRRAPAPEDDRHTPLDRSELEEGERELAEDPEATELGSEAEEADDWGPGAGGR